MNIKKIIICIFLIVLAVGSYAQDKSKYTTTNVMLKTIYQTKMGLIVEYHSGGKLRQIYLPNKFFDERVAVIVKEDNTSMTPQMNVVYKDLEPFRVKLYLPTRQLGLTYKVIQFMSTELQEKFKSTEKLVVVLTDEGDSE